MVSMAKAVCIMLMVVGHSGSPGRLNDVIYLFHMPCFFFISGYLLKTRYFATPGNFVKKKVKGYYWPFVKWSLIFLALHGVFYALGFYGNSYTMADYGRKLFGIATMTGSEQLLGGFWFLKEIMYSSLISFFVVRYCRIASYRWGWVLSVIFAATACAYSFLPFKIPTIGSRTLLASAFFTAGFAYRLMPDNAIKNKWAGVVCMCATVALSFLFTGTMDTVGFDILAYYAIALIGTVGVVNLMSFVPEAARPVLDFIGSRTLYILVFHFVCFKFVSLLKIWHYDLGIERLADFPVVGVADSIYWIYYSAVGIAVPLIFIEGYRMIRNRVVSWRTNGSIR